VALCFVFDTQRKTVNSYTVDSTILCGRSMFTAKYASALTTSVQHTTCLYCGPQLLCFACFERCTGATPLVSAWCTHSTRSPTCYVTAQTV
jgi:hypothetical protein